MKHSILKQSVLLIIFALIAANSSAAEPTDFLNPPAHIGPHKPLHLVTNRAFQGIPSMAVSPKGRLWATWYAGKTPGEDHNNYVVLSTSGDNGKTWKEVLIVDPDEGGPVRTFDPELWLAPDGKLRLFWAQNQGRINKILGVWSLTINDPESAQPTYQKPERITDGVMMCKPLVLSTGEWVLPASTWHKSDNSARMVVSADQGKTWQLRGACHVPKKVCNCDEHMFVERQDGSLWLLVRTLYGIGESVSTDGGVTWPELKPSSIAHPTARFFIQRLNSGNLLLVKHGPIGKRTGRSHLTAYLSADDGQTWSGGLLLDERSGVSYPDGQQTADGTIRIIYDFKRTRSRHILMASFHEQDVAAGKAVTGTAKLRQLVSEGSGGLEKKKSPPPKVRDNNDGAPLKKTVSGTFSLGNASTKPFGVGEKLFTDRGYVIARRPAAFEGAMFLRTTLERDKQLRCTKSGMVYILTPAPDRNGHSQTENLLRQGFEKVAFPEVPLFDPSSAANFCTVYQKECKAGETLTFGKWAVPVLLPR